MKNNENGFDAGNFEVEINGSPKKLMEMNRTELLRAADELRSGKLAAHPEGTKVTLRGEAKG